MTDPEAVEEDRKVAPDIDPALRARWRVPAFDIVMWRERSAQTPRHRRCVVIPVLNEGERITRLLARIDALAIPDLADIVIIDGGGTDGSLAPEALQSRRVRGLLRKTGPGKLSAQLRCAYAFAVDNGYVQIVTIDGNDKDDPAAIPEFFAALDDGYDFVQASRFIEGGIAENTPAIRTAAIRLLHAPLLSIFSGFHWTDTTQGFRGYSRGLLVDPQVAIFRDVFTRYELLAYLSYRAPKLKYRCIEIATRRSYPASGAIPTKIGWKENFGLIRTLITACSGGFDP